MELWKTPFTAHGKAKGSFPTSCKQRFPQLHKQGSYTHSHNAGRLLKLPLSPIHLFIKTEVHIIKNVNTGYMVRAPTRGRTTPLQLNTATPQHLRSVGTAAKHKAAFFIPKNQLNQFFQAARRQKVRTIWHFLTAQ